MQLNIFELNGEFVLRRKSQFGRTFELRFITKKELFEKLEGYKFLLEFEDFNLDVCESLSIEVSQIFSNVEKNQY